MSFFKVDFTIKRKYHVGENMVLLHTGILEIISYHLIHPLNKIIYQMMKIRRPIFSLLHGYI